MIFQEDFEQMRSLEQDLTFLSAKTEFDESGIPFKKKNLGIQNQDGIYTNLGLLLSDQCKHTIKVAVVLVSRINLCASCVFPLSPSTSIILL